MEPLLIIVCGLHMSGCRSDGSGSGCLAVGCHLSRLGGRVVARVVRSLGSSIVLFGFQSVSLIKWSFSLFLMKRQSSRWLLQKKSRLLLITTTISEATKGYSRDIAG
jgi:hypothetical protein